MLFFTLNNFFWQGESEHQPCFHISQSLSPYIAEWRFTLVQHHLSHKDRDLLLTNDPHSAQHSCLLLVNIKRLCWNATWDRQGNQNTERTLITHTLIASADEESVTKPLLSQLEPQWKCMVVGMLSGWKIDSSTLSVLALDKEVGLWVLKICQK